MENKSCITTKIDDNNKQRRAISLCFSFHNKKGNKAYLNIFKRRIKYKAFHHVETIIIVKNLH